MSPRVIVVAKRSAYGHYVEEENDPRVRALLRRRDPSVSSWKDAHKAHSSTLEHTLQLLEASGARTIVVHRPHAVFDTGDADLVVTVGGDGTLLAASHNVGPDVPILGVNSSPRHSVGFFCSAHPDNLDDMLDRALRGRLAGVRLARMRVTLNGRVRSRRVLNEALYCHEVPAATSRYILSHAGRTEEHRSSGFWIGTAAGSTGAQHSAGGKVLPLSSQRLQLVVREPYAPRGQRCHMLRFFVAPSEKVRAKSKMQKASMFLDGPYKCISVALGDVATFSLSDEPLRVLGLCSRRRS